MNQQIRWSCLSIVNDAPMTAKVKFKFIVFFSEKWLAFSCGLHVTIVPSRRHSRKLIEVLLNPRWLRFNLEHVGYHSRTAMWNLLLLQLSSYVQFIKLLTNGEMIFIHDKIIYIYTIFSYYKDIKSESAFLCQETKNDSYCSHRSRVVPIRRGSSFSCHSQPTKIWLE